MCQGDLNYKMAGRLGDSKRRTCMISDSFYFRTTIARKSKCSPLRKFIYQYIFDYGLHNYKGGN